MSECHALQKKNAKSKSDLLVSLPGKKNSNVPEEYVPFIFFIKYYPTISCGSVSFLDSPSGEACHYSQRYRCFTVINPW